MSIAWGLEAATIDPTPKLHYGRMAATIVLTRGGL